MVLKISKLKRGVVPGKGDFPLKIEKVVSVLERKRVS